MKKVAGGIQPRMMNGQGSEAQPPEIAGGNTEPTEGGGVAPSGIILPGSQGGSTNRSDTIRTTPTTEEPAGITRNIGRTSPTNVPPGAGYTPSGIWMPGAPQLGNPSTTVQAQPQGNNGQTPQATGIQVPPTGTRTRIPSTGTQQRMPVRVPKKTLKDKAKAFGKVAGRYTGKGLKALAKSAPRKIGQLYGAATWATVGAISSLATNDATSNMLQYTATGAALGYATGWKGLGAAGGLGAATSAGAGILGTAAATGAGYVAGDTVDDAYERYNDIRQGVNSASAQYEEELYGSDASKVRNQRLDEKFLKDKKARKQYEEAFGKDGREEAMNQAIKYRQYGVTDDKMIIKAMQLEGLNDQDTASEERIGYAKIASTAKTEKELQDYGKRLQENGIDEEKVKEINRIVRDMQKV